MQRFLSKFAQACRVNSRGGRLHALEAADDNVRFKMDLIRDRTGCKGNVVAGIAYRLLALRADIAPGLVEAFHEISVARLNSAAQSLDVRIADTRYGGARHRPLLQESGQFNDGCLALRRDAGLVLLEALLDPPAAEVGLLAEFVYIGAAV